MMGEEKAVSKGKRFYANGIRFDDLQWEKDYSRVGAYGQAKLANLDNIKKAYILQSGNANDWPGDAGNHTRFYGWPLKSLGRIHTSSKAGPIAR